jgi:hypothetical protein
VSVGSFVAPLNELWHRLGVQSTTAECLHGALAFPYGQRPERSFSIQQQPSAQKAGCAQNLSLGEMSSTRTPEGISAIEREDG